MHILAVMQDENGIGSSCLNNAFIIHSSMLFLKFRYILRTNIFHDLYQNPRGASYTVPMVHGTIGTMVPMVAERIWPFGIKTIRRKKGEGLIGKSDYGYL